MNIKKYLPYMSLEILLFLLQQDFLYHHSCPSLPSFPKTKIGTFYFGIIVFQKLKTELRLIDTEN